MSDFLELFKWLDIYNFRRNRISVDIAANVATAFQSGRDRWKAVLLLFWLIGLASTMQAHASEVDSLMIRARLLYYESVDDQEKISPAIDLFNTIGEIDKRLLGRTKTYIGSLIAVKAKFAFWPHDKWKFAQSGLRLMDEGLKQNPDDIESLFVHGVTCYFLPEFFGRGDDAQRHLRKIVRLLPEHAHSYDPKIIANVINFIAEKIRLNSEERQNLMAINLKLAQK
ncbi:hypothetical protein L0337_28500 [candidate division KSB1 bacterium]|nr:hypothetical protein [candidate division KSB1 bacterium]